MMSIRQGLMTSGALTAMLVAAPALAQTAATTATAQDAQDARSTGSNEDIIVTAQKREQTLIEVPQSISVISSADLARQQANDFTDLMKNSPGLQLVQATPGQGRLVMRGLNTGGVASTVAVYVDDTPFGSSTALANGAVLAGDFETFDVARVEVLRGPQGTLYGASSLGGILKYVTNAPDPTKFEGAVQGALEGTDNGAMSYKGAAMINIPLGPDLAFRASGSYRKQGGFIDSIGTGGSDVQNDINGFRNYGGRASLLWTPDPALSVRLSALLQNLDVDAASQVEADPATLQELYGKPTLSQYVPSFSDVHYRLYNGLVNYDLGFATLTSSTSYSTQRQTRRDDSTANLSDFLVAVLPLLGLPAFPANDLYLAEDVNNRKWTEEVRLASAKNDTFEWLLGGYYNNEKALIFQHYAPVAPGTLTPVSYPYDLATVHLHSNYEEIAGFANATLHLGDHFDFDFGGRYSHNSQTAAQDAAGILAGNVPINSDLRSSDDVFTYSVAPKFKINDRAMVYLRVAKGYRPGGPNAVAPNAPAGTPLTFRPDTTTSYEGGVKYETRDRSFSIEAAAYHIDWNDIQLIAYINNFGVNINGKGAVSNGAEVTATLRPIPDFVTSINFAYTDAHLTGDTDPLTLGAVKGDQLPFSPKVTVSVNADYDWHLSDTAKAFVGGSIRALSRQSGDYDPTYLATYGHFARVPAYEVVDLRAGVDFGRFSLEVYAKNVANARGITSVEPLTANGLPIHPNGAIGTGIIRPRTVGVSLSANF